MEINREMFAEYRGHVASRLMKRSNEIEGDFSVILTAEVGLGIFAADDYLRCESDKAIV